MSTNSAMMRSGLASNLPALVPQPPPPIPLSTPLSSVSPRLLRPPPWQTKLPILGTLTLSPLQFLRSTKVHRLSLLHPPNLLRAASTIPSTLTPSISLSPLLPRLLFPMTNTKTTSLAHLLCPSRKLPNPSTLAWLVSRVRLQLFRQPAPGPAPGSRHLQAAVVHLPTTLRLREPALLHHI